MTGPKKKRENAVTQNTTETLGGVRSPCVRLKNQREGGHKTRRLPPKENLGRTEKSITLAKKSLPQGKDGAKKTTGRTKESPMPNTKKKYTKKRKVQPFSETKNKELSIPYSPSDRAQRGKVLLTLTSV